MPRPCSVCANASRLAIHAKQRRGATYEALAAEFGVSKASLSRHFNSRACLDRIRAEECPPGASCGAPGAIPKRSKQPEPVPPLRRRAIGSRPKSAVQPVAVNSADEPAHYLAAPVIPKSPTTSADELAILQSLQYSSEQISAFTGLGAEDMAHLSEILPQKPTSLFDVASNQWITLIVRQELEHIMSLRNRQRAAESDLRWRDADAFDAKIAAAMDRFKRSLFSFGLVRPVDPSEVGNNGSDVRDIFTSLVNAMEGQFHSPPQKRRRAA